MFSPVRNQSGRQTFCSRYCRHSLWQKTNKDWVNQYKKDYRLRYDIPCRECGKPIPQNLRRSGVTLCSNECRNTRHNKKRLTGRKKNFNEFHRYKVSLGCSRCGYNECPAALDFHHKDENKKERRVTATMWKSGLGKDELKKCVLLCSNCHRTQHYQNQKCRENGDVF